jgi:hypothetical protein
MQQARACASSKGQQVEWQEAAQQLRVCFALQTEEQRVAVVAVVAGWATKRNETKRYGDANETHMENQI